MKRTQKYVGMLLAVGCALVGSATVANAATYYVSPSGNDSNPGTLSAPFQTVNRGVSVLVSGDTLIVRGGTYRESLMRNIPAGTSWDNKVRVAAYPGETVWLVPGSSEPNVLSFGLRQAYIELDGINLDGSNVQYDIVKINWGDGNYAHHVRIKNAELKGSHINRPNYAQHVLLTAVDTLPAIGSNEFINLKVHGHGKDRFDQGFYIQSPNNLVEGCDVYDVPGGAIEVYNGYWGPSVPTGNIIRNNRVHHSAPLGQAHRGIFTAGDNTLIYNNVIDSLGAADFDNIALWVWPSSNNVVVNNTLYGNAGDGIVLGYDGPAQNTIVRNNIVYQSGSNNYRNWNSSGTILDHNLFGTNPLFVNPASADFHLQSSSPAIDVGTTISVVTVDKDGVSRPQGGAYDVGAHERGSVQQASPPAPPTGLRIVTN